MRNFIAIFFASLLWASIGTSLAFPDAQDIVIESAWARASIGSKRPSAAYMTIRNTGDTPITLKKIETPLAKKSEIHRTMTNDQGVGSMVRVGEIQIPPGESAKLEPGSFHVMLMKLQSVMNEGGILPLTLFFSDGNNVEVEVPILSIAARGPKDQ